GEASARRPAGRWRWRAAAAGLALVALGESVLLARQAPPRVIERMVYVPMPLPAAGTGPAERVAGAGGSQPRAISLPALGQTSYERLTAQVLRYGLDGLPAPSSTVGIGPSPPASSGELLHQELRRILDPGDPS